MRIPKDPTFWDIKSICDWLQEQFPAKFEVTYRGRPDSGDFTLYLEYQSSPNIFPENFEYHSRTWDEISTDDNQALITFINIFLMGQYGAEKQESTIDWNRRMLKMASGEINTWSKDPSTKVSATIFRDKHPIASSYNGFPPGIEDTPERLNDRELKYKYVQHAEANAISVCAKLGISTQGTTMAVTHFPCSTCAGMMIAAGISKVIVQEPDDDFMSRWKDTVTHAKSMFAEAGVELVQINIKENENK